MTVHGNVNIFDERPVQIGGFILSARGASVASSKVRPTAQGWQLAFEYSTGSEESSPYWVGDLLAYAADREDWREKFDQMVARTKLAPGTLHNRTSISRAVTGRAREISPSITHSAAVAGLDPEDQVKVLRRARDEELNVYETRKLVKHITRPRVVAGQAELKGKYRVIYADPPWTYDNNTAMPDGSQTPAEDSYQGMTIREICDLPIEAHARKDAVLFMWSTNSHLLENPGPREVIEAWGFEYKTNYVWDKVLGRPGHYSYVQHEILIVATRGRATPDVGILQHDHASIFQERRQGQHSEKPKFARKLITSLYTEGPYLELFGRKRVDGWTVFGNDARLWSTKVSA